MRLQQDATFVRAAEFERHVHAAGDPCEHTICVWMFVLEEWDQAGCVSAMVASRSEDARVDLDVRNGSTVLIKKSPLLLLQARLFSTLLRVPGGASVLPLTPAYSSLTSIVRR